MQLSDLPLHTPARVQGVTAISEHDPIAQRLEEIGFIAGETVEITAIGPMGKEPLLVRIGNTRFALRRSEANRIYVLEESHG